MKRLVNILMIFSMYMLLCGKSCVDDREQAKWEEKQVISAKDSIRDEFETDHLTEEARQAAEVKAIQEIKDLADYVEIYTDASMDLIFREKAGELIRGMFISKDNKLSFGIVRNNKMKSVSLGEFLEKGFGNEIKKTAVIFDSIRVLEPLQKSGDELYSGKLIAYQTLIGHPLTDSIISPSQPLTIEFTSSKQQKIIGKDTLKVWVVTLGDMDF